MRRRRRNSSTLFITGASGFLGRHVLEAASAANAQVVALPSDGLDVRNRGNVIDRIATWKPSAVIHLAYRRDDREVIVLGSSNVAEAAAAVGAHLVHLSTDMVFGDMDRSGRDMPYDETDAPDPATDYGRWKAEAEHLVRQHHPGAVMIRTSLLYGTDHPATIQRDVDDALWGRSTMSFFTDEFRCPAHAADVAAAAVDLAGRPDVNGPLHVAGPRAVSRAELAAAFARSAGIDPGSLRTASLAGSGLERPARIVLDTRRAEGLGISCRSLEDALRLPTA